MSTDAQAIQRLGIAMRTGSHRDDTYVYVRTADLQAALDALDRDMALRELAAEVVGRWAGGGAVSHRRDYGVVIEGPFVLAMDALKDALAQPAEAQHG